MTRLEFNIGIAALKNAFPSGGVKITPEAEEIYWRELQFIPQDIWQQGISKCIIGHSTEYSFFPGVHDIGVACFGEQKEEYVWKCDPWRTIQNYKEKVELETWQQRMGKIIAPQQIENRPRKPSQLEKPKFLLTKFDK